jgi:hypothetical protein
MRGANAESKRCEWRGGRCGCGALPLGLLRDAEVFWGGQAESAAGEPPGLPIGKAVGDVTP